MFAFIGMTDDIIDTGNVLFVECVCCAGIFAIIAK